MTFPVCAKMTDAVRPHLTPSFDPALYFGVVVIRDRCPVLVSQ